MPAGAGEAGRGRGAADRDDHRAAAAVGAGGGAGRRGGGGDAFDVWTADGGGLFAGVGLPGAFVVLTSVGAVGSGFDRFGGGLRRTEPTPTASAGGVGFGFARGDRRLSRPVRRRAPGRWVVRLDAGDLGGRADRVRVLLDLDSGAGGEHRGGDDAGDRLGPDRAADRADPAGRAAAADCGTDAADGPGAGRTGTRGTGPGGRGARSGATAEPELGGDEALQGDQRPDRREGREDLLVGADLGAEVGALVALANVAAYRAGDLAQPLGRFG